MAALDAARRYRHAGIVVGAMGDAEWIGLGLPAIGIESACVRLGRIVEYLVDRHHLARLRIGEEFVVVIAPPRGHAAAEDATGIFRGLARTRHNVENAHFQHVAGLRVPDCDGSRADVHAKSFAGAAAKHRRIHRPCPAAVDRLAIARPAKDVFRRSVTRDHALGVVGGMLGQGFDRDHVAGPDFGLRLQRPAEESPVNPLGLDRQMMMDRFRRHLGCVVGRRGCRNFAGRNGPLMAKQRQCILRPAAMTNRHRRGGGALGFLLAEFARRKTKPGTERSAEICGIAEPVTVGDLGNRMVIFPRVGQVGPGALQPALADIVAEIITDPFEQLLQVSLGNPFALCHTRRRQAGILEPPLDDLADAIHDRCFGGAATIADRRRHLPRQCEKQIGEPLRHRVPLEIGQRIERLHGGGQRTRKDPHKSLRRHGSRLDPTHGAGHAAMECFTGDIKSDCAEIPLEKQGPVAVQAAAPEGGLRE